MANPGYLRSTDGDDADNGSTWALANATLVGSFSDAAAGDDVYVSDVHAETQSSGMTLTSPGTAAAPCRVVCGDDAAEPPTAVATTGTIDLTSGADYTFAGFAYVYGLMIQGVGSGTVIMNFNSSNPWAWTLDNCKLIFGASSASGSRLNIGSTSSGLDDQVLEFINTDLSFIDQSQGINCRCRFIWRGGTLTGSQTELFKVRNGAPADALVSGVDLSAMGSGDALVDVSGTSASKYVFVNCKLGASVSIITGTIPGPGGCEVDIYNCDTDAADTNWRSERYRYQGSHVPSDTIYRDASDGTTPISWKIVTLASPEFFSPFKSQWITGWIGSTGSKTWKGQIVHDSATNLQDDEIWLEVEYLGTNSSSQSTMADDRMADILATPADQSTTGDTWTGAGGFTNENTQDVSVTATVNEIGPWRARFVVAKLSYTVYCDPKIDVT